MKVREIESAGLTRRILETLDAYFKVELSMEDPLLDELEVKDLAGGDWLMKQGDPGDALYFLVRGRLQAWARDSDGSDRGIFLNEIVPGSRVPTQSPPCLNRYSLADNRRQSWCCCWGVSSVPVITDP